MTAARGINLSTIVLYIELLVAELCGDGPIIAKNDIIIHYRSPLYHIVVKNQLKGLQTPRSEAKKCPHRLSTKTVADM
jgi:hypothetical protein